MRTAIVALIIYISLGLAALIGWVMNIITLFGMETVATGEGVARIVGIPIPLLGAVLGYF